jgi:hypothetical protein
VREGELQAGPQDQEARDARPQAARLFSQLLQVARNKGYSPGWVANKYRAMFDVWPRGMRDVAGDTDRLNCCPG